MRISTPAFSPNPSAPLPHLTLESCRLYPHKLPSPAGGAFSSVLLLLLPGFRGFFEATQSPNRDPARALGH